MYFRDAATDKRLMNHKAKKEEGIGSIISVPIVDKGKMLGILSLYTKEIREFTKDEIDFLSILAEQGGFAIENANLNKAAAQPITDIPGFVGKHIIKS